MKKIILTAIAIISLAGARAQEVLTLDECRNLALQNNVAIRNSALQSNMAKATRREAFTKYFPDISAVGMAFTANKHVLQYDVNDKIPIPPIPGILPEGGAFPFSIELSMIKKGVMAGANLVQPVFMGGMIVNGNKLAEVGEAVAELQSRQSADQVRLTVEQYYWQLASLKAKRATVDDVLALLDTLERQVNVAVDAGVVLRNDLLEVQLRKNEMITNRLELDNGISVMSILLGQYIGKGVNPIDIAADINAKTNAVAPDTYFVNYTDALYSTISYQLLQQNVKATDLQRRITLGENLPKVAVGAGYFYHNVLDHGHGFGALYATVAIPFSGWWGGSHAIKRSNLNAEMARNKLSDASQLLEVNMVNSWNALTTAYDKIGVAREGIAQANENLRLNENYYHVGTATITDLLKAQTLYRQSHDRFVDAYGEYQVKIVEYLQATGR